MQPTMLKFSWNTLFKYTCTVQQC